MKLEDADTSTVERGRLRRFLVRVCCHRFGGEPALGPLSRSAQTRETSDAPPSLETLSAMLAGRGMNTFVMIAKSMSKRYSSSS